MARARTEGCTSLVVNGGLVWMEGVVATWVMLDVPLEVKCVVGPVVGIGAVGICWLVRYGLIEPLGKWAEKTFFNKSEKREECDWVTPPRVVDSPITREMLEKQRRGRKGKGN